jgi:hypothetical protein
MSESTTHDPLCVCVNEVSPLEFCQSHDWCRCDCDLIRQVRSDTLDTVRNWLSDTTPPPVSPDMPSPDREAFLAGYQLGRVRDLAAVEALRGTKRL